MPSPSTTSANQIDELPEIFREPDPASPAGRIYRAARQVFSRDGFKGATTRAIAEAAGLNQALVHYYFGSKAALYRRVLSVEVRSILLYQTEGRLGVMPLDELLATFPGRLVGWFRQHPEAADLLRREIGSGSEGLREIVLALGAHGPLGVRRRLAQLQKSGEPGQQVPLPTDHIFACILSLSYGLILIAPLLETVFKLDLAKEAHWKGLQTSLELLLRHGISAKEAS